MDTVHLSPADNIVVLARSVNSGECIRIAEGTVVINQAISLGHKLALRQIQAGEKILKYGAPIGSALTSIAPGEHVHLHNMKSDYLPTYTLDDGQGFHSKP